MRKLNFKKAFQRESHDGIIITVVSIGLPYNEAPAIKSIALRSKVQNFLSGLKLYTLKNSLLFQYLVIRN